LKIQQIKTFISHNL